MIPFNDVQAQLASLDPRFYFMGVSEVKKLARTLEPQEKILECMKVWHKGRATLLCATDQKIVCLDVRSVGYSVPNISYHEVKNVFLKKNAIMKTIHIHTQNGIVQFKVWRMHHATNLKRSIDKHLEGLKNKHSITSTAKKIIKPTTYKARNWRSLVKKVGAASMAR